MVNFHGYVRLKYQRVKDETQLGHSKDLAQIPSPEAGHRVRGALEVVASGLGPQVVSIESPEWNLMRIYPLEMRIFMEFDGLGFHGFCGIYGFHRIFVDIL